MKALCDEITRKFPEVWPLVEEFDLDSPYVVMASLVRWLNGLGPSRITPEVVDRLVEFATWCEEQPRGGATADDVYTILCVSFYEELFRTDVTRCLIPRFLKKDDVVLNAGYLKSWVGAENYRLALEKYL